MKQAKGIADPYTSGPSALKFSGSARFLSSKSPHSKKSFSLSCEIASVFCFKLIGGRRLVTG